MPFRPLALKQGLLTETLDDELLVYDQNRQLACRLNRTAALIWEHSDGKRGVDDLVALLHSELGELADEDLVLITLDRLDEQGLIESGYTHRDPDASRMSRRRFIRRVGVVGSAALALPVVQSIIAPSSAAAQGSTCHTCYYCWGCDCGCIACGCAPCYCSDKCYCEGCYDGYCTYCSPCKSGPTHKSSGERFIPKGTRFIPGSKP